MQPTETAKVELTLSGDSRLLAGVSGAVNHVAERAGMDEPERANLVAAIEDACHEVFRNLPQQGDSVQISLAAESGRVEVILSFHVAAARPERADKIQSVLRDRLDRVTCESRGDTTRLALVKNVSVHPTKN